MTVKSFFKGNVFKCLITLLCVLLVSGIFLTLMNGLLEVTAEEQFQRAMSKIYGKTVATDPVPIQNPNPNSTSTIEEAYKVKDDGNYLIKSTGKGGYSGGTVTCWVVVEITNGSVSGIGKVVVDSYTAQTQMAELNDKFMNSFSAGYEKDIIYSTADGYVVTNSTMSSNAVCMAVNGALVFVNGLLGNTTEDIYKDFAFTDNIETKQTRHVYNEEDGSVTFTVVSLGYGQASGNFTSKITVNADGTLREFEVINAGSTDKSYTDKAIQNINSQFIGKNAEQILAILNLGLDSTITYPSNKPFLTAGATNSTYSLYTAAVFATANYEKCIPEQPDGGEEATPPADGGETDEGGND